MYKRYKILVSLFLSLLIFLAFTPPLNPTAGGWTQQFMPNLGGRQITDITFLDSLTGYAVASQSSDSSYVLKTTNGGANWLIIHRQLFAMTRLQFLNLDTGYIGGGYLYRTTNGGFNWTQINTPAVTVEEVLVLNQDTIWFVNSNSLVGGVYRTTNGGVNWDRQFTTGTSHIYMYNARIGFIDGGGLKKTTDGGFSWTPIAGEGLFSDMHFVDSLTGWKCLQSIKKTTDGGLTWVNQTMPSGGNIVSNYMSKFSFVNRDTIWGVGGAVYLGSGQYRGIIYKTTNGGVNWGFQLPDTAIYITGEYKFCKFTNKLNGWAYSSSTGVHTVIGGSETTYTSIKPIRNNIPTQFKLFQNYPNPFNPRTVIKYEVRSQKSEVRLIVYDITGKEIIKLVNKEQNSGTYEVDFSGNGLSSGVYFYKIQIITGKEVFTDTKKMILIK